MAFVPVGILYALISVAVPSGLGIRNTITYSGTFTQTPSVSGAWVAGLFVVAILLIIMTVLSDGALATAISARYLGQPIRIGQAYVEALHRLGALVLLALLIVLRMMALYLILALVVVGIIAGLSAAGSAALAVIIGFVAGVGAIVLFMRIVIGWTVVVQVVMLEHSSAAAAFRRSTRLVQGFRWKVLGLLVITGLLVGILEFVPEALVAAAASASHFDVRAVTLINNLVSLVFEVLLTPIPLAALTLLFYDLKIRKEAFDLEMLAGHLSSEPSALSY